MICLLKLLKMVQRLNLQERESAPPSTKQIEAKDCGSTLPQNLFNILRQSNPTTTIP